MSGKMSQEPNHEDAHASIPNVQETTAAAAEDAFPDQLSNMESNATPPPEEYEHSKESPDEGDIQESQTDGEITGKRKRRPKSFFDESEDPTSTSGGARKRIAKRPKDYSEIEGEPIKRRPRGRKPNVALASATESGDMSPVDSSELVPEAAQPVEKIHKKRGPPPGRKRGGAIGLGRGRVPRDVSKQQVETIAQSMGLPIYKEDQYRVDMAVLGNDISLANILNLIKAFVQVSSQPTQTLNKDEYLARALATPSIWQPKQIQGMLSLIAMARDNNPLSDSSWYNHEPSVDDMLLTFKQPEWWNGGPSIPPLEIEAFRVWADVEISKAGGVWDPNGLLLKWENMPVTEKQSYAVLAAHESKLKEIYVASKRSAL